jgi:16S rRNA (adenine1518-N6/adenine1519-N6)-dimethyltransferase
LARTFCTTHYVIDAIVAAIHPQEGQVLVEIGPGLGALTEPVASQVSHMHVVELERDLAERLRHLRCSRTS